MIDILSDCNPTISIRTLVLLPPLHLAHDCVVDDWVDFDIIVA